MTEELLVNVFSYAYPEGVTGNAEIALKEIFFDGREMLCFSVKDAGEPFNPLQVRPEGGYYSSNYAEGGMGMAIIRQIAGEIFYRTQENRNVLTIRFPVIKVN